MRALLLIACIGCSQIHFTNGLPNDTDNKTLFKYIYKENSWLNKNTRSGNGSDLTETPIIRLQIPQLIEKYGIKTMLDAGCGEFFWQKELDLSSLELYMGIDIVPEIIEHNSKRYQTDRCTFALLDIVSQPIPTVDMILCRDVFQHLSDTDIQQAINAMKKSGSKYLLTSTFVNKNQNEDPTKHPRPLVARVTGRGRNLQLAPFNFPKPIDIIEEGFENKTLGLWKIEDLPTYQIASPNQDRPNPQAPHLALLEE